MALLTSPANLRPGLSILLPAYNEEPTVAATVQELVAAAEAACDDFEIVAVDDGSRDRTGAILDELTSREPHLRVLHHEQNQGLGGALTTAGRSAAFDESVVAHVDNPLSAEQLRAFLQASGPGVIVVGYRPQRLGYRAWQRLGARVYHSLACLLFGLRLRDVNWLHLYPTPLFSEVTIECNTFAFLVEVLAKGRVLGCRFVEVEAPMIARTHGVATISQPRKIWGAFRDLISLWWRMRVTGKSHPE